MGNLLTNAAKFTGRGGRVTVSVRALVKGLVELHGGGVVASSQGIGRGAEFEVRLPLDLGEATTPSAAGPAVPRRGHRVLIIEDSIDAADMLQDARATEAGFAGHLAKPPDLDALARAHRRSRAP